MTTTSYGQKMQHLLRTLAATDLPRARALSSTDAHIITGPHRVQIEEGEYADVYRLHVTPPGEAQVTIAEGQIAEMRDLLRMRVTALC